MEEKTKNDYLNEESQQTKDNKSKLNGGLETFKLLWRQYITIQAVAIVRQPITVMKLN